MFQRAVGERVVIALDDVIEVYGGGAVARNREAHGVGAVTRREAGASSAGIAKIAERAKSGVVRLPGLVRRCAANASPGVTQRQHGGFGTAATNLRRYRIEVGTGHFRGIVTQAMASTRLDILKNMVEQNPNDSFLRYGLAMEYKNAGNLEEATRAFRDLMAVNPDYSAAYFHGGQALEKLGKLEEAREMYQQGLEVTTRKGDLHTRSEIQTALDML
jgi:tetratricopeptide (TPR) repeat protein